MISSGNPRKQLLYAVSLLLPALAISLLAGIAVGGIDIPVDKVFRELAGFVTDQSDMSGVLWQLRIPRVLLAAMVGAILAASGTALQGLLGNPLAEPYTAGVSSGCVLGASLALLLGLDESVPGGWGIPALSFVTGLAAVILVFAFARRSGKLSANTFLLSGIIVGSIFWAVTNFILAASREDLVRIFMWMVGSFSAPDPWRYLAIVCQAGIITLFGLYWCARDLNAFALGEEAAAHLGVRTERLKALVILLVTFGTAACVSASGVIGFVGLVVPHGLRRIFGHDNRVLIVGSALGGAAMMTLADLVARTAAPPSEIPIGVITALIGGPVFLAILLRGKQT